MIRINLTPLDHLENRFWYIPDLAVAIVFSFFGWVFGKAYLNNLKAESAIIQVETEEINQRTLRLRSQVRKYKRLRTEVEMLGQKLAILENLTGSKVDRYKPIIVLEHLQNLRLEGLWFNSLNVEPGNIEKKDGGSYVTINGASFDPLLVAEFMTAIKYTQEQPVDPSDMRTFVYFSDVYLESLSIPDVGGEETSEKEKKKVQSKRAQAFARSKDQKLTSIKKKSGGDTRYPELSDFPTFTLRLKYSERGI